MSQVDVGGRNWIATATTNMNSVSPPANCTSNAAEPSAAMGAIEA